LRTSCDVRELLRHRRDDFAPQDARVEHVRLVDRSEAAVAPPRGLEADARDAPDLGCAVAHGIETFVVTGIIAAAAARLAEINVSGQLADDHQVESRNDVRLDRRRSRELGIQQGGTQVGEESERLADREDPLFGPHRTRQRVVARTADGAEQHRVGGARERERGFG
jgi:hypothetical protein